MSDREPPREYRHAHQDIRLGGWKAPAAKGEILGDVAVRVVDGIAKRYASGQGYTPPAAAPSEVRYPPLTTEEVIASAAQANDFLRLSYLVEEAAFRYRRDPSEENHATLSFAEEALARYLVEMDQAARIIPKEPSAFQPTSIEILTDLGITSEPTGPVQNFTDIWCIFCDRDSLDFIGTNRNESRVEIALTLHAAFATMIRMSGFSDEVLEASGINLDDPCLETLANFLNERTHDHYSFGPYETSIDERLFNFLQ